MLIEYGCEVNALSASGESALHITVRRGRLDCTMVLLTHGAMPNTKEKNGNTPLHLAMQVGLSSFGYFSTRWEIERGAFFLKIQRAEADHKVFLEGFCSKLPAFLTPSFLAIELTMCPLWL